MTTTFDFGDGNGEVSAHRHINPDGSIGGWVAETAFVEETAYIGKNAAIFGRAVVSDNAIVTDNAKIFDEAFVCDNAKIYGNARINGDAFIFLNLNINKDVDLLADEDIEYESFDANALLSTYSDSAGSTHDNFYDFGDGNGRVRAYPHTNPDGSIGGWVADSAFVGVAVYIEKNALVFDNASVHGNAKIYGTARIYGDARIFGDVCVYDNAEVYGDTQLSDNVEIFGNAKIYDSARIYDNVKVYGSAEVYGDTQLTENVRVLDNAKVFDNARLYDHTIVQGDAEVCKNSCRTGHSIIGRASKPVVVKKLSQQPTAFKIPPPPEPLQFNSERVAEIKTESKKLTAMLNAIYEQDEVTPVAEKAAPQTTKSILNLDETHLEIVKTLATRPEWERDELQKMMKGMMIDGVLEHINDAFFDCCGEAFIEGDDPIEINVELYKEIFK